MAFFLPKSSFKNLSRKKLLAENHDIDTFMKRETTIDGFGKRPAFFRKAKDVSQKELGDHICVSNRVISYYERESKYPPVHLIAASANILGVSTTDELLGLKMMLKRILAPATRPYGEDYK
ncbi:MAG: helix-turn-helix transcriptional regulator [Deltaproteobacteria bacterium]|nr:helix-turn-helix transcriptional regulator [Deltaproteobacteria bacterium]